MERKGAMVSNHPMPSVFSEELLILDHGQGCEVIDSSGKNYLDFGSGISVNALGYGRDDLADVAYRQMKKLIHVSNLYTNEPALELAEKLIRHSPPKSGIQKVQFTNSGSEANETAIKYARLFAKRKGQNKKFKIGCFSGAFHGRTLGVLSCTPTEKYQIPFEPLIPGVYSFLFNDVSEIEKNLDDSFCAVIIEVVQGEGGLEVMNLEFAKALQEICQRNEILIITDEVQTGLGRTGNIFASEMVDLVPDIITLAKPLAGGLPLAATLIPEKINVHLQIGDHGTTFGGGPVTCAVGNYVWDTITGSGFLETVKSRSRYLNKKLNDLVADYSMISKVKGTGLLTGLQVKGEVDNTPFVQQFISASRENGLLTLRSGTNVLRLAPPLIVSEAEIDKAISIIIDIANYLSTKTGD